MTRRLTRRGRWAITIAFSLLLQLPLLTQSSLLALTQDRSQAEAVRKEQQAAELEKQAEVNLQLARRTRERARQWHELAANARKDAERLRNNAKQYPAGHRLRIDNLQEAEKADKIAAGHESTAKSLEAEASELEKTATEKKARAAKLRAEAAQLKGTQEEKNAVLGEILGTWKWSGASSESYKETEITITSEDRNPNKLFLAGKHKDWEGTLSNGELLFTRKPTADEMNDKAPEWARKLVAAQGTLRWRVELTPKRTADGSVELIGKWYQGELRWREKRLSDTNEVVPGSQEASDTGSKGPAIFVAYAKPNPKCADTSDRRIFKLTRASKRDQIAVEVSSQEPLGIDQSFLEVQLQTLDGTPVEVAEVKWEVSHENARLRTAYFTETDERGIAQLAFGMLPTGDFAPANQLRMPQRTLPAGTYNVSATVPDLGINDPVTFKVNLKRRGVLLNITDSFGVLSSDLTLRDSQANFRVEVIDRQLSNLDEITVKLSSDNAWSSTSVTIPRQALGVYSENKNFTVVARNTPAARDLSKHTIRVRRAKVSEISVEIPEFGASTKIRVYADAITAQKESAARTLIQYKEMLNEVRDMAERITDPQSRLLNAKMGFIERAQAILQDSKLPGDAQLIIVSQYFRLLSAHDELGLYPEIRHFRFITNPTFVADDAVLLPYQSAKERALLGVAQRLLARSRENAIEEMRNNLVVSLRSAPGQLKTMLEQLIAAPAYSFYVLVFASTLDGQDADLTDRLFAGLDLASFFIRSPIRIGTLKPDAGIPSASLQSPVVLPASHRLVNSASLEPFPGRSQWARDVTKRVADKLRTRKAINTLASKHGLMVTPIDASGSAIASVSRRFDETNQSFFLKPQIPAALKPLMKELMQKIWDNKIATALRNRFLGTQQLNAPRNFRRDIGNLQHLRKYYESKMYWESEVQAQRAIRTAEGGYRAKLPTGELGSVEERIEWSFEYEGKTRRIDQMLINHKEKTICINDLAAQLKPDHLRKGEQYVEAIKKCLARILLQSILSITGMKNPVQ